MPDLKARLRAKFTRRQSGSVGELAKENSSAAASFASSVASSSGQRSPLVSRNSTSQHSQHSQHPPTAAAAHSEHETNHRGPDGYFNSVKSGGESSTTIPTPTPTPTTNNKPKCWNVGEEEDDSDQKRKGVSPASSAITTSATGMLVNIPAGSATSAAAPSSATVNNNGIPSKAQASDMNGNDLRPPISRLPSINEQPAIEQAETNGAEKSVAISSVHSTTDDDDPFPLSTPLPMRETHTIATPKVVPPTPETQPTPRPLPVSRPSAPTRQQSLLPDRQTTLIQALLRASQAEENGLLAAEQLLPIHNSMVTRKIWVRRPGSSATQVTINEEDLVDDVRDMILRKYGNSLGRQFDSPDLTLRIVPREKRQERTLGPEEPMGRTLDAYFPGGQTVDEALVIDVPLVRRTPRASPRTGPPHATHLTSVGYYDEVRPTDSSTDYFGPNVVASGGHLPMTVTAPSTGSTHPHSMSVLSTGQVPQIPSPGGARSRNYRDRPDRPRLGRQHTSSPTIIGGHPVSMTGAVVNHSMHDQNTGAPAPPAPPMPTSPAPDMPNSVPSMVPSQRASTPPPRTASPRPLVSHMAAEGGGGVGGKPSKPKKKKTIDERPPALPASIMNNGVPPINVLIVEDNIINLKLLEAFVKRLKVRWSTAMNGRDAVTKWRTGGFHLVLMDIQLPIMSGLDATREIRRLERVNSVGVFSGTSAGSAFALDGGNSAERVEPDPEDKLVDIFKSPVIIVALTASSLQSDRHEALAAGCNDFLTKPVNFIWLERKVMEWGCMQALIDFDGWRKWKDFSGLNKGADDPASEASKKSSGAATKSKKAKNRTSMSGASSSAQVAA